MKKRMIKMACCLVLGGALLWLLPSTGFSQCTVTIGGSSYGSIQAAIAAADPYQTIQISGTCSENLFISELKDYIRLIGSGPATATIQGTNSDQPTITTIGKGTLIQALTITGLYDAIQVIRGGTAFIEGNTIEGTGRHGVVVAMNSFAHLLGNTIQDNAGDGVVADTNSLVRVGIRSSADSAAILNTIRGNLNGVTVARSSTAQIVGNEIRNNSNDGIRVAKVSQADISGNVIEGNGRNGILVTQNSGVNLGRDTGEGIFDLPNSTIVPNGAYGLQCEIGGYADGRLGTLNGGVKKDPKSATSFTKDCIDSLIP
jgi:nitrous oxidase accessory protein NosD